MEPEGVMVRQIELADAARNSGQSDKAISLYRQARTQALAQNNGERAAYCLHMTGVCYKTSLGQAIPHFRAAAKEFRALGLDHRLGNVLRDAAAAHVTAHKLGFTNGYLGKARELLEEALEATDLQTDADGYGLTAAKLGYVLSLQRQDSLAQEYTALSLEMCRDPFNCATSQWHIAQVLAGAANYIPALEHLEKMKEYLEQLENPASYIRRQAECLGLTLYCRIKTGRPISPEDAERVRKYLDVMDPSDRQTVERDISWSEIVDATFQHD